MLYYHLQVLFDGPGQFSTNGPSQNSEFPAGTFNVPASWTLEQGECLAIVSVIECRRHRNEIQGSTQNNEGMCHVSNTSTVQKLSREMIFALIQSEGGLVTFDTSWSIRLGTWGIGRMQGARILLREDIENIERRCGSIPYNIPCLVEHSVGGVTHGRDMGWCFLEPGMFLAVRHGKYVDAIFLGSSRYGGKGGSLTEVHTGSNEKIVSIGGRSGHILDAISFGISDGRAFRQSEQMGGNGGSVFCWNQQNVGKISAVRVHVGTFQGCEVVTKLSIRSSN